MSDTTPHVVDARLKEALDKYFNGVALRARVGDCAILSAIRKQNSAPVDIYTPSYEAGRDDAAQSAIAREFDAFAKLGHPRLQAVERLLSSRAFKKHPALALLSCPVPVFDDALDTRAAEARLGIFDQVLDALAALHSAGIVHGNISEDAIRRESQDGAARLCDFGFPGGRTTTVLAQPAAYQSRHVINTSAPRLEDDVHAAGMLGYRLLLGPHGAERVLTGSAEAATQDHLVASILGEETAAPTLEDLFPEGHPSAAQIARLLARMTGRLTNAAPYSSASAALKAFRSVIASPTLSDPQDTARISAAPSPDNAMASAALNAAHSESSGVSRPTAMALFGGFLVSTAAAVYFYTAHQSALAETDQAMARAAALEWALDGYRSSARALRAADVKLAEARFRGAEPASPEAAEAFGSATASLSEADAALETGEFEAALSAADTATAAAAAALAARERAEAEAATARTASATAAEDAERAAGGRSEAVAAARSDAERAESAFTGGTYSVAAAAWQASAEAFAALTETLRMEAEDAKDAAAEARAGSADAEASAGFVRGKGLENRASAAYEAGHYDDAARLYGAAAQSFAEAYEPDAVETPAATGITREVTFGDTPEAIDTALQLCRDHAPVSAACGDNRPSGEAVRSATLRPFALDPTEVSAGDFAKFVAETGYSTEAENNVRLAAITSSGEARLIDAAYTWKSPQGAGSSYEDAPDLPVRNVSAKDAAAYCAWAGARLPSEAEWETAARAPEGLFPWGAWPSDTVVWRGAEDPRLRLPQPVADAGAATATGLQGLSGNAREWVIAEDGVVLKGGSWNTANPADLRVAARLAVPGNPPGIDFGFRCARDLEAWP